VHLQFFREKAVGLFDRCVSTQLRFFCRFVSTAFLRHLAGALLGNFLASAFPVRFWQLPFLLARAEVRRHISFFFFCLLPSSSPSDPHSSRTLHQRAARTRCYAERRLRSDIAYAVPSCTPSQNSRFSSGIAAVDRHMIILVPPRANR